MPERVQLTYVAWVPSDTPSLPVLVILSTCFSGAIWGTVAAEQPNHCGLLYDSL